MAGFLLYLSTSDIDMVVAKIDGDEDLAWLVEEGAGRWRAAHHLSELRQRMVVWHVPSGPLPLFGSEGDGSDQWVADPWRGWAEGRPGNDQGRPYFGPTHTGTYGVNVSTGSPFLSAADEIGLSSVTWTGNHFGPIGKGAAPTTEKHWRSLRRWARKVGIKVPCGSSVSDRSAFAFPGAAQALERGAPREAAEHAQVAARMEGLNPIVWRRTPSVDE